MQPGDEKCVKRKKAVRAVRPACLGACPEGIARIIVSPAIAPDA